MMRLPRSFPAVVLVCAALLALGFHTASAQVVISEFMAANVNTNIRDEDGSSPDWIELHNPGVSSVNLNGWYLTDDRSNLRKWQFPQTTPTVTLAAGARLVVWASEKNRKAAANRLHTNFKLADGGEYLALVRPDGLTVEHQYPATYPNPAEYPPQATDISYGISGSRQWNVLAGPTLNTQWKVRVPQSDAEFVTMKGGADGTGPKWNAAVSFDTAAWATKGTTVLSGVPKGVGYDYQDSNGDKAILINYAGSPNGIVKSAADVGTGAASGMYNTGSFTGVPTLCIRTTFPVTDPSTISQLRLNVRYDDGIIVYLNGVEILNANGPNPSSAAAWNSAAASDRENDLSDEYQTITLAGAQQHLVAGTNVLAIHGFNEAKNSGHFVVTPSLEAFQVASGAGASAPGYLSSPTPGAENTIASTAIGPDITLTTKNPNQPTGGAGSDPLLVTARLRTTLNPIASVKCNYIINFGTEVSLTMVDNGTGADATANDGIYSAHIPTTSLQPGHLLRWRIVAADNASPTPNQSTDPPYRDPFDNEQYFGTMAKTPAIQSQLPVFFWFHNSTSTSAVFATSEGGFAAPGSLASSVSRSAVFYQLPGETSGRYYDSVRFNLHGQSTAGFSKKSQNVNFNADNRFRWRAGEKEVGRMNLLSNWADKARIRNALAWEFWNQTGHPSHWCQPVRIQQITANNVNSGVDAQFLCIADMTEDGDDEFLERWGLDPNGSLYKIYNRLDNVDQSLNGGYGVEKKTREYENFSDLQTLVNALNSINSLSARRQWLYDNIDVPGLINYLAVHNLINSHDFGHKNYYIYRDTNGTGEWTLLPWDQDLSFGHRWTSFQNYFDDDIFSAGGIFIGGGDNWLMRMVSGSNELAQMYLRRLRTLMDQYYGPSTAPVNHFNNRIAAWLDVVDPPSGPNPTDAMRDFNKWGFWVENPAGGGGQTRPAADSAATQHTPRATALRITTENNLSYYPGENPYSRLNASNSQVAYGATPDLHTSLDPFIPGRRSYLYNEKGLNTSTVGLRLQNQDIPGAQTATPNVVIENIVFNPGTAGQNQEFFVIRNPNSFAVDISGWKVDGAVKHTFRPGTIIPAQGTSTSDGTSSSYVNQLVVAKTAKAFRQRSASPKGLEYRQVQGGYEGQLSARGERIQLFNAAGSLVASSSYNPAPTASQQSLRVTELNYAPAPPTAAQAAAGYQASDFEFIEITNTGAAALSLGGAGFSKGITFTFPAGFTLQPGARALIVSHQTAFGLRYGSGFSIAGQFEGTLDNAGEELELVDSVGEVVLSFAYSPAWYPAATGGNYSLVMRAANPDYAGYETPANWALSGQPGGSPGGADTAFTRVFEGWRYEHFTTAEVGNAATAGATANPDGDGLDNFTEYAFGRNPKVNDGAPLSEVSSVTTGNDKYLAITFRRQKLEADLTYVVEVSDDVGSAVWTPVDLPVGSPVDLGNGIERVTYRDFQPMSGEPRFIRVTVIKQ